MSVLARRGLCMLASRLRTDGGGVAYQVRSLSACWQLADSMSLGRVGFSIV